jgi:hypothetical protein
MGGLWKGSSIAVVASVRTSMAGKMGPPGAAMSHCTSRTVSSSSRFPQAPERCTAAFFPIARHGGRRQRRGHNLIGHPSKNWANVGTRVETGARRAAARQKDARPCFSSSPTLQPPRGTRSAHHNRRSAPGAQMPTPLHCCRSARICCEHPDSQLRRWGAAPGWW